MVNSGKVTYIRIKVTEWNELQKVVSTAHPGTFEIAPKDKNAQKGVGLSGFYEDKIEAFSDVNYRDAIRV